jgi:thiopeptide-type bacteriocin biosynthesis protein
VNSWLSLKIYCGETVADRLLAVTIAPVASDVVARGMASRWFFVRYVDPHHHLRVRFLTDGTRRPGIHASIRECLAEAMNHGLVWKIDEDRYEPETDRYGASTMTVAESMFHHDSELVAEAVRQVRAAGDEHLRWRFALDAIARRLGDFGYSAGGRASLLDRYASGLLPEFGEPRTVRRRIDARARELRDRIEAPLDPIFLDAIERHSAATAADRAWLVAPADDQLWSHLHMFCNRLFVTRQRLHELVVYLFLARRERSTVARQSKESR